jgi:spermidine synthase
MNPLFEELDFRKTPMGELVLRRRRVMALKGRIIYEVRLGDEYLMSSLFYAAEAALAQMALSALEGRGWNVAVGGLGLGYTAAAALEFEQVKRLVVIEALEPVIDWHRQNLVPNGPVLQNDPRCIFVHGDFFGLCRSSGFDPDFPGRQFDAVLLDIDHSPDNWLAGGHGEFYTAAGLSQLKSHLKSNGVFALWSNDAPTQSFLQVLSEVFDWAEGRTVCFDNPLQQTVSENGIYLAGCRPD